MLECIYMKMSKFARAQIAFLFYVTTDRYLQVNPWNLNMIGTAANRIIFKT
jgi:hypothetical protein